MARIIGGIGCSHTPTIGFAHNRHGESDPVWGPIFAAFTPPVRHWLEENQPDVAVVIYNDHVTSFFFDHHSAFALGIGERFEVADEGGGPRDLPAIAGHPGLAAHVGQSLVADEFDMSFFQDRPLDHGCFSPLSLLCRHDGGWPFPIVPLQVGVVQAPSPARAAATGWARRCAGRSRAIPRTSGSRSSPPAGSRIRCMASAPASTTRAGTLNSSSSSRRIRCV